MLTKKQKTQQIEQSQKLLQESKNLIFIDFGGKSVEEISALRVALKEVDANLKVIKKRLMKIVLEQQGFNFNPGQFNMQVGTIFTSKDIFEIAGSVYKSKIQILGGYDLLLKNFIDAEQVEFMGKLPPREILLGQLVGMLSAPIKMFMRVLDEKSKQTVEN